MKTIKFFISLSLALCLTGCGESSEAEQLYEAAVQMEQQAGGDRSYSTIEAYRQVIRTAPKSSYAEKAQKRIDAIQQRIEARRSYLK